MEGYGYGLGVQYLDEMDYRLDLDQDCNPSGPSVYEPLCSNTLLILSGILATKFSKILESMPCHATFLLLYAHPDLWFAHFHWASLLIFPKDFDSVQSWRVPRPFSFGPATVKVGFTPELSCIGGVCRCSILHENEVRHVSNIRRSKIDPLTGTRLTAVIRVFSKTSVF